MKRNIPRIMLASAMSGGGKTTAVCALLRILKNRGYAAAPFKCGPDYIDPMFHRAASGRESVNLDGFFCSPGELKTVFAENTKEQDIAVIEGVMGYYDGRTMDSADASSYDTARTLGCPTVLILPAGGMAYTVIPLIKGMVRAFGDSKIKAVILNHVSKMTYMQMKPVIEKETGIRAAGYIPKLERTLKSRHLGLVTPAETENIEAIISDTAQTLSETVDTELILRLAAEAGELEYPAEEIQVPERRIKIGIAYDQAFCFYYKDNLDILKKYGAEPVFFSPLRDKTLPDDIGGVIFGGGYPEVYAERLSQNTSMLRDVKNKLKQGMPCLAECGGFLYLHSSLEGEDGVPYRMADVISAQAFRTERLVRFGYVSVQGDNAFIRRGEELRAHEFHYWDSSDSGSACMAVKPGRKRSWACMHASENIFAGFAHIYYRSDENFVQRFLEKSEGYIKNG